MLPRLTTASPPYELRVPLLPRSGFETERHGTERTSKIGHLVTAEWIASGYLFG